jgi:hypothetical protein
MKNMAFIGGANESNCYISHPRDERRGYMYQLSHEQRLITLQIETMDLDLESYHPELGKTSHIKTRFTELQQYLKGILRINAVNMQNEVFLLPINHKFLRDQQNRPDKRSKILPNSTFRTLGFKISDVTVDWDQVQSSELQLINQLSWISRAYWRFW